MAAGGPLYEYILTGFNPNFYISTAHISLPCHQACSAFMIWKKEEKKKNKQTRDDKEKKKEEWVQWLRICPPVQGMQVQSPVGELRSHMRQGN